MRSRRTDGGVAKYSRSRAARDLAHTREDPRVRPSLLRSAWNRHATNKETFIKNDVRTEKSTETNTTNAKAAELLRDLDDAALAAVSGGGCRTCGIAISLDAQVKAVQ